jgi:16S rRNA (uracil1498-N3)-methyltransferase
MKIRNRVFVKDHLEKGQALTLDQRAAHYLFHVLRCQEGEYISIFNESSEWLSKIDKINSKDVQISIEKNIKSVDTKQDITLYFSPIKKNQTELVIQKCTEIGVTNFQPVLMERTNFSSFNIDRLSLIAIEAIEQSEQMKIPSICEPIKLEELLSRDQKDLITLVCSVEENSNSIRNVLKNNIASNYSLMVGPEGDFSETEMNNLKNKGNYFMVSLGDTVLKSETASITAAGILKDYLLND